MQLRETIELSGIPFPKPLPIQAEILIEFFSQNGFKFEKLDRVLLLNEIYSPNNLSKVKKLIESKGLDLKIDHSIWTEYEDSDFKENPLWILYFPEIWIDGIDFKRVCKICKKRKIIIDFNVRIPIVKSKKPIVTVNGQFTIVKKELKKRIAEELSGARFEPFDETEEYFHLLSRSDLGELINTPDDFFGYNGICPECKLPVFKMFYGSLTYSKSNWNGEDIVSGTFHSGVFFTKKAYKLLKSVEKETIRDSVVILK